jgi:chromosome partitioning protein
VGRAIAIFSGKGGVGKSTLAANLAVLSGSTLIDADPQATCCFWGDRREGPPSVLTIPLARVPSQLRSLPGGAVIDTPGVLSGGATEALQVVNLIVIPVVLDQYNLDVLPQTLGLASTVDTPTVLVINRLHPRASIEEAITLLEETSLPVCPRPVRERVQHRGYWAEGRVAADENEAAGDEIRAVWSWLEEMF